MNSSNLTTSTPNHAYKTTTPVSSTQSTSYSISQFEYAMYDFNVIYMNILDPILSIGGFLLNLACCGIFSTSSKFNSRMYRLLFWVAFCHMSINAIEAFYMFSNSKKQWISHSYATAFYLYFFKEPVKNMLIMMSWFCSISVSWERYILVSQTKLYERLSKVPVYALVILFAIVSILTFTYELFGHYVSGYYIYMINGTLYYYYTNINQSYSLPSNYEIRTENEEGVIEYYAELATYLSESSLPYQIANTCVFVLRDIVLWFVFFVINVLLVYETMKHFRKKRELSHPNTRAVEARTIGYTIGYITETLPGTVSSTVQRVPLTSAADRAQLRVTLMVILTSSMMALAGFFYFMNMLLDSGYLQETESNNVSLKNFYLILYLGLSDTLYYFSYAVSFFVYLCFDKNFRGRVFELFKRVNSFLKIIYF